MNDWILTLNTFWNRHPALLYGLCLLLGFYASFEWSFSLLVPIGLVLLPQLLGGKQVWIRSFLSIILFLAAWIYGTQHYQFPNLPNEGIKGTAHISISSIQSKATHFGYQWMYQGTVSSFTPDNSDNPIAKNISYSLSLPRNDEVRRPLADQSYVIQGTLKKTSNGQYIIKTSLHNPWRPIQGSWSLAEYRYKAKQSVKQFISSHISNPDSAAFLSGLATGEFENRLFALEFGRFGLQHIMAISGFHFAIIAGILSFFLRFILPRKSGSAILIALLSSYFLFLGCGPSIMRAWIAISVGLGSYLIEKQPNALNSLGVALMAILLLDPLASGHMGFQFSFLTTASILILYSPCDHLFKQVLTKRPLCEMVEMNLLNQHGYYILSVFRQGLSLSLAVNLVALPVTLYYFQKFPWMSLLYNLFFPIFVSGAMFLLLIGSLFSLAIPFAAGWIHHVNSAYTQWLLNFTFNMPTTLDVYLRVDPVPSWILVCYLSGVFLLGIFAKQYMEKQQEEIQDFAFL